MSDDRTNIDAGDRTAFHYGNAVSLLTNAESDDLPSAERDVMLAAANVHATLAVAVATRELAIIQTRAAAYTGTMTRADTEPAPLGETTEAEQ